MKILLFLTRYLLFLNPATHIFVNFDASVHILISKQPAPLFTLSLTNYYYYLFITPRRVQLTLLYPTWISAKRIQNSLTRAVIRAPKSSHMTPSLRSLHKERIDYKILSVTYKVLTTTEPSYLYNLISLQPLCSTRSSDVVTLACPPSYSSESQQSLFPPCLSSLEWTSHWTSTTCRWWVPVTVIHLSVTSSS